MNTQTEKQLSLQQLNVAALEEQLHESAHLAEEKKPRLVSQ